MSIQRGVSVVICCYNSIERLQPTLTHIANQKISNNILWEVIIVDNNSDDGTTEYAVKIWKTLNCNVLFRIVSEPQSGLSFAREKGIYTAQYEYILFCDDDNWLDSNYIDVAMSLLSSKPNLGIVGGCCRAISDVQFPYWFDSNQSFYAIGEQKSKNEIYKNITFIYGAGMILNKSIYLTAKKNGFHSLLTGRNKKNLSSGEDTEICFAFKILGFDIHYTTELTLQHYIPKERLNINYLINIRKGILRSNVILSSYRDVLSNNNKPYIYHFFLLAINFFSRLPIFFYRYLTSDKLIAIVGFYHYYYRIRYYKDYIYTRNSIRKWKKNIKKGYLS
jgi:glycosyltransferase involved in cell wall biosynthesis